MLPVMKYGFGKAAVAMENFVCAAKFLEWRDIIIRSAPQSFIVAVGSVVRGEWHAVGEAEL